MDYLFLTARGCFTRREYEPLEGEAHLKGLVKYDSLSRALSAHAVPQKGVDEQGYIVEQVKQDVLWLGHAQIAIRSDNEPALVAVVDDAAAAAAAAGHSFLC